MAVAPDAYLKAVAAIVALAFAVVVAAAARRGPPLFLAGFLALIGLNQAMEIGRSLAGSSPDLIVWFRLATVAAAFDPLFLYCFAGTHPEPSRLRRGSYLVLAVSSAFAIAAWWLVPTELATPLGSAIILALTLFTAVVYTVVLVHVARTARPAADRPGLGPTYVALGVLAVPVWTRTTGHLALLAVPDLRALDAALLRLAFAAVAILAFLALVSRLADRRKAAARGARLGIAIGLGLTAADVVAAISHAEGWTSLHALTTTLGRSAAALRFLLFGALVSTALIREDVLGLSLAARRRVARVLLGLSFLVAATFVLVLVETALARPAVGAEVIVLLVAVGLSQGFHRLVDAAASRLFGVPPRGDAAAAHDAYVRAASAALAQGRDPASDAQLARLRADLSLDPRVASVLHGVASETPTGPLETGQLVAGRYRVRALIGRGGSGRAFLATDETLMRDVVLKETRAGAEEGQALREAQTAGALQHPNVVAVHDVLRRGGAPLLVVEHVPGGSLADILATEGKLPPERAAAILRGVLEGLVAVHELGIVHRDLKPSNVLLAADGTPKIADFGLARRMDDETVARGDVALISGTPQFMAPEQRRGDAATLATDVYLAGRLAAEIAASLPANARAVVERALRDDPSERWPNAREMLAALRS